LLSESTRQLILAETERYPRRRSAFLPALQLAQAETGWLSPETLREVAGLLDADPNALYDLATFYSLLHTEPVGRSVVRVCDGLSCYLRGADRLIERLCAGLGVAPGGTSPDGRWTLESFECLAACDGAPALLVDGELVRNAYPEQADALIEDLRNRDARA
jgi:NADH-quinone oxidoreductase subunit E